MGSGRRGSRVTQTDARRVNPAGCAVDVLARVAMALAFAVDEADSEARARELIERK
jgi:hypothetical protein